MTTINPGKSLRGMQAELRALEKNHGGTADLSSIKDPSLKALARTITTGCGGSIVNLKDLRAQLKTIGSELRSVDKNKDGKLDVPEQKKLSPLAARLLQAAGDEVARPSRGSVSTGCGTPVHQPVSTGCSTTTTPAHPRPAPVHPKPAPSVSTGCGTSTNTTPVHPKPVRTGC